MAPEDQAPSAAPPAPEDSNENLLHDAFAALAKIADITKDDAGNTTAGKSNAVAMDVLKAAGGSPVFEAAGLPQAQETADYLAIGAARYHDMRCHPNMLAPYTKNPYDEYVMVNGHNYPYRMLPDSSMAYSFDAEKGVAWGTFRMSNWS